MKTGSNPSPSEVFVSLSDKLQHTTKVVHDLELVPREEYIDRVPRFDSQEQRDSLAPSTGRSLSISDDRNLLHQLTVARPGELCDLPEETMSDKVLMGAYVALRTVGLSHGLTHDIIRDSDVALQLRRSSGVHADLTLNNSDLVDGIALGAYVNRLPAKLHIVRYVQWMYAGSDLMMVLEDIRSTVIERSNEVARRADEI